MKKQIALQKFVRSALVLSALSVCYVMPTYAEAELVEVEVVSPTASKPFLKREVTGQDIGVTTNVLSYARNVFLKATESNGVGGNVVFKSGPPDGNGDLYEVYKAYLKVEASNKITIKDRLALFSDDGGTGWASVADWNAKQVEGHAIVTGSRSSAYIVATGDDSESSPAVDIDILFSKAPAPASKGSNIQKLGQPVYEYNYNETGAVPGDFKNGVRAKESLTDAIHVEAANGTVKLGQIMSKGGNTDFYKTAVMARIYVQGKNVIFVGGGLEDASRYSNVNASLLSPTDLSHFSIDAGNAVVIANGGNLDTTGFDPTENMRYNLNDVVQSPTTAADIRRTKQDYITRDLNNARYLGNVRNRNGGLILEAIATPNDDGHSRNTDTTGKVYLHDVVVENFGTKATLNDVTGDMIIKGQHIIQQKGVSGKHDASGFSNEESKGTFMNDGISHLISAEEIKMQNVFTTNGEIHATAGETITADLYTNNADNENNTDLIKHPELFGRTLNPGEKNAKDKEVKGTIAEFFAKDDIAFNEIDLSKATSVKKDTILLDNKKVNIGEGGENQRDIYIGKLTLKNGNKGSFLADTDIQLGDLQNVGALEHVVDGDSSVAIFEAEKGSIKEYGKLIASNNAKVSMYAKNVNHGETDAGNILLDSLSAESGAHVELKTDAYNDPTDMNNQGVGLVTVANELGLHTGGVVDVWGKKSKGDANKVGVNITKIVGDGPDADKSNLGRVTSHDANIYIEDMEGSSIVDLYRSDAEGVQPDDKLISADWQPTNTMGINTMVGSIRSGSNVFSMTLSTVAKESDYLYIAKGSSEVQTVSLKNYAGLTAEMKRIGRNRVPFATVFQDLRNTFQVSGQPESWYGRLQRNEFKIVKYKADNPDFNVQPYAPGTFHTGANGKLIYSGSGEGTWDQFMKDNELTNGTLDLSQAYTYYLEFICKINTTATGSFDSVIRQQWILANDMEPDVDQLNGSFRGAKYSEGAFDKREDGKRPIRKGLWGRYNRNEYRGIYGGMTANIYEIGVDNAWKVNDGISRLGISAEYTLAGGRLGDQVLSHDKYTQGAVRLYDMWFGNKGHYYNLMFKAGSGKSDYEYRNEGIRYFGNYDRNVTKVSFEYGRKKDLLPLDTDKDWVAYFIPQFQFQYAHQEGTSFTTSDNIHVSMTPTDSALMRVGFQYGFQKNKAGGAVTQWFLRANLYREFLGRQNITMRDSAQIWDIDSATLTDQTTTMYSYQDYRGTWGELGIGTNVRFNRDASMYFDSSYYFGEAARKKYSLNLGFEFRV